MVTLHLQSSFAGFDSSASYEKLFALFTKPCNKRKEGILELDQLLTLRVANYKPTERFFHSVARFGR